MTPHRAIARTLLTEGVDPEAAFGATLHYQGWLADQLTSRAESVHYLRNLLASKSLEIRHGACLHLAEQYPVEWDCANAIAQSESAPEEVRKKARAVVEQRREADKRLLGLLGTAPLSVAIGPASDTTAGVLTELTLIAENPSPELASLACQRMERMFGYVQGRCAAKGARH